MQGGASDGCAGDAVPAVATAAADAATSARVTTDAAVATRDAGASAQALAAKAAKEDEPATAEAVTVAAKADPAVDAGARTGGGCGWRARGWHLKDLVPAWGAAWRAGRGDHHEPPPSPSATTGVPSKKLSSSSSGSSSSSSSGKDALSTAEHSPNFWASCVPRLTSPDWLCTFGARCGAGLIAVSTATTLASPFLCVGAGILALFVPGPFASTISNVWVEVCLALLMLCMSLTLTPADIWGAVTRPWLVALSLALEYGVAPLSALALGYIFRLSPINRVGLTLVACVNGGQASNLCTFIARGDLSISVLMTLSSSLLATVAIPGLSKLYLSGVVAVNAGGLAASTAKQVLAPLVAGVVVKACAGRVVEAVEPALSIVGIVALVIIVLGTTSLSAELIKAAWSTTLAPVALFHVIGFWFGFGIARLLFRMRRPVATAIAFESGFKSPALSYVLARRHFDDAEVQTASAVSILVLVPLAMGAAVAFHLWYVLLAFVGGKCK